MTDNILEVHNLNKRFGAVQATQNLSFSVQRNHIHALIGPNGAGKTTLVNQLTGDILSDSGKILYNSRDVTRMAQYKRARLGMARSFQITHIFDNLTVAENMALSICSQNGHNFHFWQNCLKTRIVRQQLPDALKTVDLDSKADLPARTLSHGEKRQLEVGMTLTGKPDLLILDEPMAGMGPGGTVEMSKLINNLKGKLTILLVEHDMNVVFSLADTITVLVYGSNLLTADPATVQNDRNVRKAYLGENDDAAG